MRAIVLALSFAACMMIIPVSAQDAPGYRTITTEQLGQMLEVSEAFELINVHIPYEGELPQTDAFIPFDTVAENLDLLPSEKGAPIVLYCKSGRMSEIAAAELARLGYTNVSHLEGGFVAWANAGRPLIQR